MEIWEKFKMVANIVIAAVPIIVLPAESEDAEIVPVISFKTATTVLGGWQ